MRDKWTEISSEAYDHTTFMMPVPGGALIRHVEKSEDGDVAVSVCFVPNAEGKTALQVQSIFEQLNAADPLLRSACVRGYLSCSYSRSWG